MTIDLVSIATWIKPALIILLMTTGIVFFAVPWLKEMIVKLTSKTEATPQPSPNSKPKRRSSDATPPTGTAEYLRIVETTAPSANPAIWWEYAKVEMTEAEVAIAEAKLAQHPTFTSTNATKEEIKP